MNPSALKRQLADLGALSSRTEAAERKILAAAVKRHDHLVASQNDLRKASLLGEDGADDRYMAAMEEIGQLNIVIAKAREALAD